MPWFFYPGIPWAQWLHVSCVLALCPASCPPYVLPWWPDISGLAVQLGMGGEAAKRVANVGQTLGFHGKNMWISLISLENAGWWVVVGGYADLVYWRLLMCRVILYYAPLWESLCPINHTAKWNHLSQREASEFSFGDAQSRGSWCILIVEFELRWGRELEDMRGGREFTNSDVPYDPCIYLMIIWHSNWTWSIYRCLMMIYLLIMAMFHSYITLLQDGHDIYHIWLIVTLFTIYLYYILHVFHHI